MSKIEQVISKYKEMRNAGLSVADFNATVEAKSLTEQEQLYFLMRIALWTIGK